MSEKSYSDRAASLTDSAKSNLKSGFKIATNNDLGRGFISAVKNITGYDISAVDGSNPDGVHTGAKKGLGQKIKAVFKPDMTKARAKKTGEPITEVQGKTSSKYYTEIVASETYTPNKAETAKNNGKAPVKSAPITVGDRPYSEFNKYSLVNYRGTPLNGAKNGFAATKEGINHYQQIDPETLINPTVTKIIEITSADKNNMAYRYEYSDFALATYFNRIPNNYMITLRRFAYPAADDIITPTALSETGKEVVPIQQPDIARAVTWLGEATGNNLSEILKFSHGFDWKEAESKVQELDSKQQLASGTFGGIVKSSKILSALANGAAGRDAVQSSAREQNAGYDSFSNTYPNHIFGPLNVIKKVLIREQGLKFEQEFSLKFEYSLRSFEGANPKLMMLDQLSNILALTYNNAPFWGGSVRYISDGAVAKPLGDLNKLRSGDYLGFAGSIVSDMGKMFKGATTGFGDSFDALFKGDGKGALAALKDNKFLNNLIGGAAMEMFNTPQGSQAVASLLTGDPTGNWHVTIGNPLNPIMVIGNLCMTDCEITFEGANTLQDFPEKLVAVIKLKPGRPRDKAEIESMFNAGRGRFYLQPDDVADINKTVNVSAYGNKDGGAKTTEFINVFRKISNG